MRVIAYPLRTPYVVASSRASHLAVGTANRREQNLLSVAVEGCRRRSPTPIFTRAGTSASTKAVGITPEYTALLDLIKGAFFP